MIKIVSNTDFFWAMFASAYTNSLKVHIFTLDEI